MAGGAPGALTICRSVDIAQTLPRRAGAHMHLLPLARLMALLPAAAAIVGADAETSSPFGSRGAPGLHRARGPAGRLPSGSGAQLHLLREHARLRLQHARGAARPRRDAAGHGPAEHPAQTRRRTAQPRCGGGARGRPRPGDPPARRIHRPGDLARPRLPRPAALRPPRRRAPRAPGPAGGPGQATLPLGEFIAQAISPALGSRDLLLFDQRGTGSSDPLSCSALEELNAISEAKLNEQCALDIGPARGDFTTAESVQDIEALRKAGGYEKLVLYGTSYGTKLALNYAERYPQRVESLVLDSVVPSGGEEPFLIPSYQAIGAVLGELCSARACAGITSNPLGDLARLVTQLRRHSLRGSVYDGSGKRHSLTLDGVGLFSLLGAGDFNPALRALLPAAMRSALRHDPDPLLRLSALSEGLVPSLPSEASSAAGPNLFNNAL